MNGQRLLDAVSWLTTPLLPGDYLGQINPLWSASEIRGRVEDVLAETSDAATLIIRPGRGWGPHRAGQYVHRARPGTILRLGHPAGEFVLPDPLPRRLLFLTAGSGITPVMAMLRESADHGMAPDVLLVHSAPTPEEVIFGTELRDLAARTVNLRLVERFQPSAPVRGGAGGRVRFTRSGREAEASGSTPLLEVGEEAGVHMPSGCRMGICYSCVAPLKSGRIRDLRTGLHHGDEGELVQTCVSAAAGTVEIDL